MAWDAESLNCVSRYLGKNVYKPAIGRRWRTDDADLNINITLLNKRFIAIGKSKIYIHKVLKFIMIRIEVNPNASI